MFKRLIMVIPMFLITVAILSTQAQEVVEFPELTGDYQVGRAEYHLVGLTIFFTGNVALSNLKPCFPS